MAKKKEKIIERYEKTKKRFEVSEEYRISFFEMLTPSFIGGIIIGLIVGIPGLSLLIFLIPFGGYFAVKLTKDYYKKVISKEDSIKIGLLSGFLGSFIGFLITFIIAWFFADKLLSFFGDMFNLEIASLILTLSGLDPYLTLSTLRLRFLFNVIICTFFGALGGFLHHRER